VSGTLGLFSECHEAANRKEGNVIAGLAKLTGKRNTSMVLRRRQGKCVLGNPLLVYGHTSLWESKPSEAIMRPRLGDCARGIGLARYTPVKSERGCIAQSESDAGETMVRLEIRC
jgi:hypothetical protein